VIKGGSSKRCSCSISNTSADIRFFQILLPCRKSTAQSKVVSNAHALVFGASGLAGWGVVDQLLNHYPAEGTFSKVTASAKRPLNISESYWPSPTSPELELVSRVNLAEGTVEEFTVLLKGLVQDIANVTHCSTLVHSMKDQVLTPTSYTSAEERPD
jgi:hypothetical protein